MLVALNFGSGRAAVALPEEGATILTASDAGRDGQKLGRSLPLGPHAGAVVALTA